jgi:hypothetical protein
VQWDVTCRITGDENGPIIGTFSLTLAITGRSWGIIRWPSPSVRWPSWPCALFVSVLWFFVYVVVKNGQEGHPPTRPSPEAGLQAAIVRERVAPASAAS